MQIHNSGTTLAQPSPPPCLPLQKREDPGNKTTLKTSQPLANSISCSDFRSILNYEPQQVLFSHSLCFPFSLPVSGSEDELYSSTSGKYILFFTLWQRSRSLFISISVPGSGERSSRVFRCQSLFKKLEHTLRRHSSLLVSDRNGRIASKVREAS